MPPDRLRFFAIASTAMLLFGWTSAALGGEPEWYAGIEIGSKGVKFVALPISDEGHPDLNRIVKSLDKKAVNNVTIGSLKDGQFRPEAIEDARDAVRDFYEQLTQRSDAKRPKIRPENLWIVASSGLLAQQPTNYSELEEAVKSATGAARELLKISQKREVELLMRGAIPRAEWDNAIIVDVGNGNTKCGYIKTALPPGVEEVHVPNLALKGTGGYRDEIDKILKEEKAIDNFGRFCKVIEDRREDIKEEIHEKISRHGGFSNNLRSRVYICGGSPFVIASILAPIEMLDETKQEVRITVEQLRDLEQSIFSTEVVDSPALKSLPEADRKRVREAISSNKDIHGDWNALIGLEILLGFDDALGWGRDRKDILFTKAGLVAWIAGFVVEEKARAKAARVPAGL